MRDREYRIGPGAVSLLLLMVVASMSVLGLLALISARGDYRLTERTGILMESEYAASAEAERKLAELDGILLECARDAQDEAQYVQAVEAQLPDGMRMEEGRVCWEEMLPNGRQLVCRVKLLPLDNQTRYEREAFFFDVAE